MDASVGRVWLLLAGKFVVFLWMRYVVAPAAAGPSRVVRAAPVLPLLLFLSSLFRIDVPEECTLAAITFANCLWLIPSKVWCLAMNRGQLVKSYDSGSTAAFALGLLVPIVIAFEEIPIQEDEANEKFRRRAYRDTCFNPIRIQRGSFLAECATVLLHLLLKIGLLYIMREGYLYFQDSDRAFWRDVCLGWVLYSTTSFVEDIHSLLVLVAFNLKMAPNFDCPFLAQSMQELWSRRYNVTAGECFKDLVYDPICEGCWVRGSTYKRDKTPSALRRAVALVLTFVVSGVVHSLVMCNAAQSHFSMSLCFFFVCCSLVVLLEQTMKQWFKALGVYKQINSLIPAFVRIIYTLTVLFYLSHLFFWPAFHETGMVAIFADGLLNAFKGPLSNVGLKM